MADIDHRLMMPPFLRVMERRRSTSGGETFLWDLRVGQPNVSSIAMPTVHSLEHFLASELRAKSEKVLAVAPMGCQTGFYIVAIDICDYDEMSGLLAVALEAVLVASEVPLANDIQCGWAQNHSLVGAQRVAAWLLHHRGQWQNAGMTADGGDS